MNRSQNEILPRKYGSLFLGLLVAVTLTFPFANLFHVLYPITLFSKSAWIIAPTFIIASSYIYLFLIKRARLLIIDIVMIAIIVLSWLIFLFREILYSEERSLLDIRYITTSLLFLIFSFRLVKDAFVIRIMAYAIVIQGLMVAAARSINFYFFPFIMVSYEGGAGGDAFINTEGELTRDLLMGSSISANHIICGMFILLSLKKFNVIKFGFVAFISIQFFMLISIFNTLSRFPMLIAIVLFIFSLFNAKMLSINNIINITMIGSVFLMLFLLFGDVNVDFFGRFYEDSGGRYEKLGATFLLILNSTLDFLIGSSSALVLNTSINGFTISDNSYGLIATSFGVPFALVYFIFIFKILWNNISDNTSLLFFLYTVACLALTNSILWESWVFMAFISFSIVSYFGCCKK